MEGNLLYAFYQFKCLSLPEIPHRQTPNYLWPNQVPKTSHDPPMSTHHRSHWKLSLLPPSSLENESARSSHSFSKYFPSRLQGYHKGVLETSTRVLGRPLSERVCRCDIDVDAGARGGAGEHWMQISSALPRLRSTTHYSGCFLESALLRASLYHDLPMFSPVPSQISFWHTEI